MAAATGFRLVQASTGEDVNLAMQRLWLSGRILAAGARLMVQHVFRSAEKSALEVVYAFVLPRDAALRRFRVAGAGFSMRSELKPVDEAVKQYEQGVEAGHLSTLARQYGDGVVNLSVGNIRPGETVMVWLEILAGVEMRDDGLRFRFPFTLAPRYHSGARSVEVEPGVGEMELPEEEFGDVILPRYRADATDLHEVGFDLGLSLTQPVVEVGSPSHPLRVRNESEGRARVMLAGQHDVPDRDLVLDVSTRDGSLGVLSGLDRQGKGRFMLLMPSDTFGQTPDVPRRIMFVVDRSGSMGGAPMEQAKKAVTACLGALSEKDSFGLIAFDDRVESYRTTLASGAMKERDGARKFLDGIDARGGTELQSAIAAAAAMLRGEGGDILVMTDGQVSGTETILEAARAAGVRIHCLGIGSASQDRFLALLARETGGISRFLTPRERVDLPAVDLFASIGRPLATGLAVKSAGLPGAVVLSDVPDSVFAGTPVAVFGEAAPAAAGSLAVEWSTGRREVEFHIGDSALGETLRLLTGARLLTELESRVATHSREKDRLEKRIEEMSLAYGLASRRVALVAVVERTGDRPNSIPKTVVVQVGMPQDTQFGAYFPPQPAMAACYAMWAPPSPAPAMAPPPSQSPAAPKKLKRMRFSLFGGRGQDAGAAPPPPAGASLPEPALADAAEPEDLLLALASKLLPDGGMPGTTEAERIDNTIVALLCMVAEGHSVRLGAFRSHVERMVRFLESFGRTELQLTIEAGRTGKPIGGDWKKRAAKLL
jgi:Ca-activated chloride channel family protein